jgi:hypothetical protein
MIKAWYDPESQTICVRVKTETTCFPYKQLQGLENATPQQLTNIEVSPLGLHWPDLDADLLVEELLKGKFGSKQWMEQLEENV